VVGGDILTREKKRKKKKEEKEREPRFFSTGPAEKKGARPPSTSGPSFVATSHRSRRERRGGKGKKERKRKVS